MTPLRKSLATMNGMVSHIASFVATSTTWAILNHSKSARLTKKEGPQAKGREEGGGRGRLEGGGREREGR